jgi:thiamine pyrophosphate-dependent acetolactate synthase large subunit-like protein
MLHRRDVVNQLLQPRDASLLVVSGLGSPTWDVAASGNDVRNFNFIGTMGQAGPFALGLALAQPNKRVLLITGDGELLMGLGVLATIGSVQPENLAIVVLDNEAYAETGGQPTATHGRTDLAAVAEACGFDHTCTVAREADLADALALVHEPTGPILVVAKVLLEPLPMKFPYSFDGVAAINRFRGAIE